MELSSRYTAITEAAARVLAKPESYMLKVVCIQCDGLKEFKPCAPEQDRQISHGLHDACKDAYKRAHA